MSDSSVLILEDDPVIAWQLKIELTKLGYPIHSLANNEIDVDSISVFGELIVLCNLKLLSGWVSEGFIKEIYKRTDQLIILTGLTDPNLMPPILKNLAVSYLNKPFNTVQLRNCIQSR